MEEEIYDEFGNYIGPGNFSASSSATRPDLDEPVYDEGSGDESERDIESELRKQRKAELS